MILATRSPLRNTPAATAAIVSAANVTGRRPTWSETEPTVSGVTRERQYVDREHDSHGRSRDLVERGGGGGRAEEREQQGDMTQNHERVERSVPALRID